MYPTIVDLGSGDESTDSEQDETKSPTEDLEDEEPLDLENIDVELFKALLQECLDQVEHEGSFATFTRHATFPNPGIYVKDFGVVGLPLSDRDAKAIAALCKQSPFGRGDETVIDESVRKTWELEASQIECRNPTWKAFAKTLADKAVTDIGVQVNATAQPYKLLLYEEGAFFKAHRDTEKVPGMFGTLVVCLPSEHTGGEVHLKHNQKQQVLQTSESSAHELSALAWYSDVQHEIKPVLSGYRLVLTYNLIQNQTAPRQTAAAQDANHEKLRKLLQTWNRDFSDQDHLIYPLSFKYTEESLCQSNLKGVDAAKGRYLDQVCATEGIYWFLGHTVKQKEQDCYGYGGYGGGNGDDDKHSFKRITVPDGRRIQLDMSYVDEDALLVEEGRYDGDPDSEDEGEYTGNENMPATQRYHDSVIVLMRKDVVLSKFKAAYSHPPESLYSYFDLICADPLADQQRLGEALSVILGQVVSLTKQAHSLINKEDPYRPYYLYGFQNQKQKREDYVKVFEKLADFCYGNGFGDIVGQIVRAAMKGDDWTSLPEFVVKQVVFELDNGRGSAWDEW
jgi:hypothetical protein